MADTTRRVSVRLSLDDGAQVKRELREVGETGRKSMQDIRSGADGAATGLSRFDAAVRAVQIIGLAAGIRAVVVSGDALTASLGRLNTALGSVERAGEIYDRLFQDSLKTGIAVTESVAAFQRFSIAAREIGATSDQVATLVGGLQRIAIVSGASQQEIAGSTQQLAQALSSGTLQGDELRSILESLPTLAQALGQELGVSIAELRKLGSEGKLTADVVFPALLRAVERLNGEFEKAPLTVGRAFGQLTVAAGEFAARINESIELSQTLARVLSGAAQSLDGIRQLTPARTATERDAVRRERAATLAAQIERLEQADGPDGSLRNQPRRGSIRNALVGTANDLNGGIDRNDRLADLRAQYAELQDEIARGEAAAGARQTAEETAAAGQASAARLARGEATANALRTQLDDRFRATQEYDKRVRELTEARTSGAIDEAEQTRLVALAALERDAAIGRGTATTRGAASASRDLRDADRELNDVLRDRERLIQANETAQERYERRIGATAAIALRASDAGNPVPDDVLRRDANAALDELQQSQQRVQAATAQTSDTARALGLTFSSAFEDAVIKGRDLQTVLQGIVQDLSRLVLRKAVTEPVANALGTFLGGAGSTGGTFDLGKALTTGLGAFPAGGGVKAANGAVFGGSGIIPFANGGVIDRPTLFPFSGGTGLMGEAGPEAILPLSRGADGKLGVQGGGSAGITFYGAPITVDARGADAGVDAKIKAAVSFAIQESQRQFLTEIQRGGSAAKITGRRR